LDTSALVMGLNPSALEHEVYSVPTVSSELIPNSFALARFTTSRDLGRLKVRSPTQGSVKEVHEVSHRVGDVGTLSRADLEVLALSLDLKESGLSPTIVSDDYAIQNVAETLGVRHASLATFGIASKFDWIYYCPACFRRYKVEDANEPCRVCGTHLKRKVARKTRAKKKTSPG